MNKGLMKSKQFALTLLIVTVLLFFASRQMNAQESDYVGSEKCRECHADMTNGFSKNIHAKADRRGLGDSGCETCHGPGRVHAESGDRAAIMNPAGMEAGASAKNCLECHSSNKTLMLWSGSAHAGNNIACTNCHQVHANRVKLLARAQEKEACFTCHYNVRASILQRSKHPLRDSSAPLEEGKMTCSSCHNPHGAKSEKLIDARSINDKCYECHTEKKAPVLWEHSPVKEDCLVCHTPHGSSNDKLLVTKVPRLCQECHMQGRHQSGPFSTGSIFVQNRSCLNCHPMVHGSNHPSGPVLQR
ncbi:MAG: cytochrome C [Nitrospirae bacterium GWD2_57_9]|nr:MAG: cytochrome C [Nitrospirae bacterium GWD2_57_9]OGW46558.1 MAG: cytochrome C [Nitrospirae bacterium GWC2_57_9]